MHITFLHGARDRQQAAASWLMRRSQRQLPTWVYLSDEAALERFDRFLWTQSSIGFIPHCRIGDRLQAETPIILATTTEPSGPSQCLLNLANSIPQEFDRFDELVEIISIDDADRLPGRERFRFYREQGHELQNVDISNGVPA